MTKAQEDVRRLQDKQSRVRNGLLTPASGRSKDEQLEQYQRLEIMAASAASSLEQSLESLKKERLVTISEAAKKLGCTRTRVVKATLKIGTDLVSISSGKYIDTHDLPDIAAACATMSFAEATQAPEDPMTVAERPQAGTINTPLNVHHRHAWYGKPSAPTQAELELAVARDLAPKLPAALTPEQETLTTFEPLNALHKHAWHGKPSRFAPGYVPPAPSPLEQFGHAISPRRLAGAVRPSRWHIHHFKEIRVEDVKVSMTGELMQRSEQRCACGAEREVMRKYMLVGTRAVSIKRVESGSFDIEGTVIEPQVRSVELLERHLGVSGPSQLQDNDHRG